MPFMLMEHDTDPAQNLRDALGDMSSMQVFGNQVLVAIYVRPQKTAGGIYLTDNTTDEDKFQGKVGLVVKTGPDAFTDPSGEWFNGIEVGLGDWVYYRVSDGWMVNVHGVCCRILLDTQIRGKVAFPDEIW
jgi:co-chaperonin GroES (HSP10)